MLPDEFSSFTVDCKQRICFFARAENSSSNLHVWYAQLSRLKKISLPSASLNLNFTRRPVRGGCNSSQCGCVAGVQPAERL
jgi:hypothetical protein